MQRADDKRDEVDDGPGTHRPGDEPRVVRHAQPMTFRALCQEVVPPHTRYLVMDLDRTVHLDLNLGEMLGWELNAHHCYGPSRLQQLEALRGHERMLLDWSDPRPSVKYFLRGVRQWAVPGMYYLLWGKLAAQVAWLHRVAVRRHGPHVMQHAQRATQVTLMQILEQAEPALVAELAERVWHRHAPRQVVQREDISWLRTRAPQVEVILASASPEPTVASAARELGIETFTYSTLERINSGVDKVEQLRAMRPRLGRDDGFTVGITDTQYGEDHCWADHFQVVVDINSRWPFPPQAEEGSPLQEVHSAQVLTAEELRRRAAGNPDYCDPRRETLLQRNLRTAFD